MTVLTVLLCLGAMGLLAIALINLYVISRGKKYLLQYNKFERFSGQTADAILVLGCRVYPDGQPSLMLCDRVITGVDVYRSGAADALILTGDSVNPRRHDEIQAMLGVAVQQGLGIDNITLDKSGVSTWQSMLNARNVYGLNRVIIVTQRFHVTRSVYLARRAGLEAYGIAAQKQYKYKREWISRLREIGARVKAWLRL